MKVTSLMGMVFLVVCSFSSCKGDGKPADDKTVVSDTAAVSKGDPFIIEVVEKGSGRVDTALLMNVCRQNGLSHPDLYQWKGHYVVYGQAIPPEQLESKLREAFPKAEVKNYPHAFYEFNRERCGDTSSAREWDHILLTANLVKDTVLQKEYLDHHATQFQQWPEVSKGFCNASFQQLLLFRSGRQLMLVISIPKGASLDELNPKTTENNPRVDDWNALMKKYQEGIEGTKPGEVWVFLEHQ